MAIAISANGEHQPAGALSPTDIKAQHVKGGGPSSVQMGQENVIALLLQQQEEVLREIRDHKKGLALSQENKQEIARLVLSSLKKHRLNKQPPESDPPPHPARMTRTASKRSGKKRAIVRRRQRNSRSSREQNRSKKHHPTPTTQESWPREYSSSSDQNNDASPSAAGAPACSPPEIASDTHERLIDTPPSAWTTTVIRQRVEKKAEQAEVSLDGLWLPSLSPSPGLGNPGTASGRRRSSSTDGAAAVRGGRWAHSSRPAVPSSAAIPQVRNTGELHVYDGKGTPTRRKKIRPVTVHSHAPRPCVQSQPQRQPEGELMPSRGGLDNDMAEGKDRRRVDVMLADDDDDDDGGGSSGGGDGRTRPLMRNCKRRGLSTAMTNDISRDTASMLQRSQSLVARAKACCGQAVHSSTAIHSNREGNANRRCMPHGHGGNSEAVAGSDGDDGAGEAGGILFAPSPCAQAGEPSPASFLPPASAGAAISGAQEGQRGGETCESGTGPAALQPTVSDGAREGRDSSGGVMPAHIEMTGDARAPGPVGLKARQNKNESLSSATASVSGEQGRWRVGSGSARKARKQRGEEPGRGGNGGAEGERSAKVDTEWENEIAKNILSLYQTKLKADLDDKESAKQNELMRKQRGYLTVEEEEDSVFEQQQQQQQLARHSNRAATAGPGRGRFPGGRDARDGTEPRTAAATSGNSNGHQLDPTRAAITPTRWRVPDGRVATLSPPSRRPVTVATKPREVMVGRDLSRGRAPQSPPRTVTGAGKANRDHAAATGGKGRGGFRGSKTITVPTRSGGDAVVVVPKRPRPIWFAGSGAIQAEWSALPGGARVVRDLEGLEEQGRYAKYVAVVEGLLTAYLRADDQRGPSELVKKLWRQLVATCIAFGVRSTENRRFERALELLKRAGTLLSRQVLDKRESQELQAFVHDAYGLYFLRRGKSSAALDYVQKAMKTHARMRDWGHVTKCHLHSSVVLSKLNRHDEALRCLGQVLSMVEEGNLDVGGNSPQKLCLVAICYHNMAVEQLILRHAGEACMSSQNARRLARLCLSYSNRWLHSFEGTHKLALAELGRSLPPTGGSGDMGDNEESKEEQRDILQRLTEELFA